MTTEPAAFMSYVRLDDQHDDGRLSQLRERLEAEVRMQTGRRAFRIFQDREDIAWGQSWQQRIDESLDAATVLLVIVTPSLFGSEFCRQEFARFRDREQKLGRTDLVLPIYYIEARELDDPASHPDDELVRVLAARQHTDWRDLRFEPFTTPAVRKELARLATRVRDVFQDAASPQPPSPSPQRPVTRTEPTSAEQPAVEAAAPTPRSEPPTLVVDPWGRGDHLTISSAIEAAAAGHRILVRPGLYEEGVVVDKPLEIIGDGPRDDIVVRARDTHALRFAASIGRVTNLTLQTVGERKVFCVSITQGRLDLEECDISAAAVSGIGVTGADPRIRRNTIHGCREAGVLVRDNGRGTVEDNEITVNGLSGIEIRAGSDPTVRRNQLHHNTGSGVHVYENGRGTLEDNEITANGRAGITIRTGSDPTVRRNQLHHNTGSGVHVYENGRGTLEDNEITANGRAGITIRTGSDPTVRRNQLHHNTGSGVHVYENGRGTVEDNEITANGEAGVEVRGGGAPTVRRNRITGNGYEGVWVYSDGGGTFEDNDLTGNQMGPWDIEKGARANVTRARNRKE